MKMKFSIILILLSILSFTIYSQSLKELDSKRVRLPNGWGITAAGKILQLGDLPLNMSVSPDKKYIAVTNNGQSVQSIQLIDVKNKSVSETKEVRSSWYGLAWSSDSKYLYASAGNANFIMKFIVEGGKLKQIDSIPLGKPWPVKISPSGIAVNDSKKKMYVVTREDNSLYVFNTETKTITSQFPLGGEAYSCVLTNDRKLLYISCWGCDKVIIFDTEKEEISGFIPVGDNPNELLLNKDNSILYVANANDNSVSVIDTKENLVIETLNAALFPGSPGGSTTNGLALSEDGKTLYIANADNNCLAVFDVSVKGRSRSNGFIPTGWYPTSVKVVGKNIFVSNGKGLSSMPNPYGPNPYRRRQNVGRHEGVNQKEQPVQYIAGLFKGTMSIIPVPDSKQLSVFSQTVFRNTPYDKQKEMESKGEEGNPIPGKVGGKSPVKYVFYVIKENRTYDQVLGDMPGGNGDTSLVLFGKDVTPNQHLLASEFVLLDNFYCDGEVSADGHNWSMGAYATDYLEKTWPTSYGGRGGNYAAEGAREIANNKGGFLWDLCKKYGVTYRSYGEFVYNGKPTVPVLLDNYCTYFTGWDESVMDTTRFRQWKQDFDSLLAINKVPQFNTIRLINDHTEGLKLGRPTPKAHVADNDLAVGLLVDYLSKSKIWKESVLFIIEDDAQNGPDHVDAHRSTCYVAGGYVKRKFIDHTMYSTSSVLRTMELILGLPPMSQYDASAEPLWRCFQKEPDITPFTSVEAIVDLKERNTAVNEWQKKSEEFYFGMEDRCPDDEFNKVIWYGVKGLNSVYPAPRRAAFVKVSSTKDEDD